MRTPRILSEDEIAKLKKMHAEGFPQRCIWEALGISNRRYHQYRRELQLPPRPGKPLGDKSPSWKGGRRKHGKYWMLFLPDHPHASKAWGYIYEHRIVMERHLGRVLEPHEIVHHKNGDSSDNRLENLELTDQSAHMSEHSKERWLAMSEADRKRHLERLHQGYAKSGLRKGGRARVKQRELTRQRKSIPKSPPPAS